jgi:flagellar assembly protein FliH
MSRFLRTDEVGEAVNWRFSALGGSAASNPYTSNTRSASDPDGGGSSSGSVHANGAAGDNAHPEYQRGLRQGLADGFRAGATHSANERSTQHAAQTARVDALIASMQQQFAGMERDVATALTELAFGLAKQVIRHELYASPTHVIDTVKEALTELGTRATHPVIWLHPDDVDLVESALADTMSVRGCQVQTDRSIRRGGCRVESDTLTIDATIETRWEHALTSMGYAKPQPLTSDASGDNATEDMNVSADR